MGDYVPMLMACITVLQTGKWVKWVPWVAPWVDLINLLGASREFTGIGRSTVFQLIFWCHVQEPL